MVKTGNAGHIINEVNQARITDRVMRQFTVLPNRRDWNTVDKAPYIQQIPDALAGLLRQYTSAMLDLGRLAISEDSQYSVYRGKVFDERDKMMDQLKAWLCFWTITDENNKIDPGLVKYLLMPLLEGDDNET